MLANINLRMKLVLSFMIVLVLMVITSSLAYKQFVTVGHEVEEYAKIVEGAAEASHIETRFLKLRTHAREYAATGRETDAKAVHEIGVKLLKDLKHAISVESNPEHLKLLKIMDKDAKLYLKDFDKVEALEHEFLGLIKERLMPEGEKITAELDEILKEVIAEDNAEARTYTEDAIKHAFMARLYSNIVIGNKDTSVEDKVHKEFDLLHGSIKKLLSVAHTEKEIELAKDVDHLAQDYEQTLNVVIKDSKEIHHLVDGEMAKFAHELIVDAEKLQEMAAKEEKAIEHETMANIETGEMELLLIGFASFASGILVAWIMGGKLAKPIQAMTNIMGELANNNLKVQVPYTENRDELGRMAASVNHFKEKLQEIKFLEREQQEQKLKADAQRRVAMMQMADVFEESVGKVVNTVTSAATELQSSANQMATTADQTNQQATAVSAATEEASANVQTVASASEELASSNQEIGRNVQQSAQVSSSVAEQAENTKMTMSSMVDEVARITSFAEMISDIADQTNMLALNATIESARAGEAGKGFAVVASEVKTLAQQTANATEEIVTQIRQVNLVTQRAAHEMETIGNSIAEADRMSSSVASAVEEQMVATQEIARSVEQAAQGTQDVATNISMVEKASGETGQAAEDIAASALELSKQAEFLQLEVLKFLDNVRAGDSDTKLLEWKSEYESGVPSIDAHHKELFEEINFYHGRLLGGVAHDEVGAALSRLLKSFEFHLNEEIGEMTRFEYREIETHKTSHNEILQRLHAIQLQHEEGLDISLDFFDTLASGLLQHIVQEDKNFTLYMEEHHPNELPRMAAE